MKNIHFVVAFFLPLLLTSQSTEISLNLGHTKAINGLRFSQDSKFLLSSSADGTIKLWDVESGKLLQTSKQLDYSYRGPLFFFPKQQLVSFMPQSGPMYNWIWNIAAGTMEDGSHLHPQPMTFAPPSLFDLEEEEEEGPNFEEQLSGIFNLIDFTNGIGYEHQGLYTNERFHYKRVDNQIQYFDIWDNQAQGTITYSGLSEQFYFSSNGKFLFGNTGQAFTIWEQSSGKVLTTVTLPPNTVFNDIAPDGQFLLITNRQGQSSLYQMSSGKLRALGHDLAKTHLPQMDDQASTFNQAMISPNGQYIARGTDKGEIYLHSYKTGKVKRTLQGQTQAVASVQFSKDEPVIEFQLRDGSWRQWNISNGIIQHQPTKVPDKADSNVMAWSTDRKLAIVNNNGMLALWNKLTNQKIRDIGHVDDIASSPNRVVDALFSPDNRYIFFETTLVARRAETTNILWSIDQNQKIKTVRTPINQGLYAKTFTPDSKQLLLSDGAGNIHITSINEGTDAEIRYIFSDPIRQMVFSGQDKNTLAIHTRTPDGAVKLLDYQTKRVIATLYNLNTEDWVIIANNGLFDASPGAMKMLFYKIDYKGEIEILELEQLKTRYYEPGLLQELMGYSTEKPRNIDQLGSIALYPKISKAEIQDNQLQLQLQERNGGMGKLSLFINGKEVNENINPGKSSSLQVDLKPFAKYYYPGKENQLSLRSFNQEGWLKSKAFDLTYTPTFVGSRGDNNDSNQPNSSRNVKPHLYGLIVGTAKYSGKELNLTYSDKDAASIHKALQSAGKALFNERVDIQLLSTDPEAGGQVSSKSNIRKALSTFASKAKAADVFVIYFAGHGVTYGQAEKLQFYYLTKDISSSDLSDPAIRDNYAISSKELTDWLTAIPAQKQVMMLDACNSGKVVENLMSMRALNSSQVRALDRMRDRTGMFVISGSAADKVSYEASQYGQGLLTYSLLKGMREVSATNNSYIDIMQLFQYSRDQVPQLAKGIGGIQTPMLAFPSDGSSFDIGIVNTSVDIPVAVVKPIFIRNNFQDEAAFRDVLGLGQKIGDQFKKISSRGAAAQYIYVDANELANAYSINGRYSVNGEEVKVQGVLIRGEKTVGQFKVSGKKGDLQTLVEDIIYEVEGMVE